MRERTKLLIAETQYEYDYEPSLDLERDCFIGSQFSNTEPVIEEKNLSAENPDIQNHSPSWQGMPSILSQREATEDFASEGFFETDDIRPVISQDSLSMLEKRECQRFIGITEGCLAENIKGPLKTLRGRLYTRLNALSLQDIQQLYALLLEKRTALENVAPSTRKRKSREPKLDENGVLLRVKRGPYAKKIKMVCVIF